MNPMLRSAGASELVLNPGQTILVPGAKYSARDGEILAGLAVGVGKVRTGGRAGGGGREVIRLCPPSAHRPLPPAC